MVNRDHLKGQIGVHLVIVELLKRDIEALPTSYFWAFDIFTSNGIKIEVKYSNIGINKGGSGGISKRFTFRLSSSELDLLDFLVLVLNTHKGYLYYVIPRNVIDCKVIAFTPFSKRKSKYEKFLNRWDLIKNSHEDNFHIENVDLNHYETGIIHHINKKKNEKSQTNSFQ